MNALSYTNRGEEVPLGVECALPYLAPCAPPPVRRGARSRNPPGRAIRRRRVPAWMRLTPGVR